MSNATTTYFTTFLQTIDVTNFYNFSFGLTINFTFLFISIFLYQSLNDVMFEKVAHATTQDNHGRFSKPLTKILIK